MLHLQHIHHEEEINRVAVLSIRNFPDDLYRSLKIACAEDGMTLRDKVISIVTEHVKEHKKKAKK